MINKNIYYNNIPGVLKSGIEIELTREQIAEIYKCKNDPIYFIENYFYVNSQEEGEKLMDLCEYQKQAIIDFYKHHRLILNWARQSRKTSTFSAFILHYTIFNRGKNSFLLSNKGETSKEILERIKFAYIRLPEYLNVGVTEFNKNSIIFGNGSKIYASTTSSDSIRGKSASVVYCDEIAFCENWSEFWSGISPTIAANKNAFIGMSSTPSGFNHFYKLVENARNNKNGFVLSEVKWFEVPGRDEKWAQRALDDLNGDEDEFAREYELQFLGASGCLISSKKLKEMLSIDPIHSKYNNNFLIYELPILDKKYYFICDSSEGLQQDFSTIQIFKYEDSKFYQVAVYKDNTSKPREFANIVNMISEYYNNALIIGESNSIGSEVLNELFSELENDNLYFDVNEKDKLGVKMTKSVKRLGCSYLKKFIENDQIIINDFDTINQLSTFISKNNSYEADSGCNDDLVTPLVIFSYLINNELFAEWWVDKYNIRSMDVKVFQEDLLPFFINVDDDQYSFSNTDHRFDD